MTTSKAALRSAVVAWLKGEQPTATPAPRDDAGQDDPPQPPEQRALAALAVGSVPAGFVVGWLLAPLAAWVTFGVGALCLIAYLLVGALRRA